MDGFARDVTSLKAAVAEASASAAPAAKGAKGMSNERVAALKARLERKEFSFANVRDIVARQKTIPGFWTDPSAGYVRTAARVCELEGVIARLAAAQRS